MLARPGRQSEQSLHYDYDNPTLQANMADEYPEGPRMESSREDIDAAAVRPNMINIIPGDEIRAVPRSPEITDETRFALPPGDDLGKTTGVKGFFSKRKEKGEKKDKKDKKDKKGKKNDKKKDKKNEDNAFEEIEIESVELEDKLEQTTSPVAKGPSIGGKLRGLFKGRAEGEKAADMDPVVTSPSSDGVGMEAANLAYDTSMSTTPAQSPDSIELPYSAPAPRRTRLPALLRKPSLPPPDPAAEPRAVLNDIPDQHHVRCSNVLNSVLITGILLGILFLVLNAIRFNQTLAVIGPCFLGLSAFALVGKVFMTLFWQEDPLPRLKPYIRRLEDKLGPKGGAQVPAKQQAVIARSSHYGQSYSTEPHGFRYEEEVEIDMNPREPENIATQAPTFI